MISSEMVANEFVMAREKFKEQGLEVTDIRYINEEYIFLVEEKR
ncbi:hypothetical protein LCGC14_1907750, partial [marine sediment metagenome]